MKLDTKPTAVLLLEFGRLLYVEDQRCASECDSDRIGQAEGELIRQVNADKRNSLKSALNMDVSKPADPSVIRLLAAVAYTQLCSNQYATQIGNVVRIVTRDEPSEVIKARKLISQLLITRKLLLRPNTSDQIDLGSGLLEFLAGGKNEPPLVISEFDLQNRWYRAEVNATRRSVKAPATVRPKQLAAKIAESVIGLDEQARTLACRIALHQHRAALIRVGQDPGSPNEALLFIGPSGSGKTWLAERAGRICELPFAAIASTDLTCEGYIGLSVDDAIKQVIVAARGNSQQARFGVCFFDEWDKKRVSGWEHGSRDVAGASVQQAVLRLMEGENHQVGGRKGTADWSPGNINTHGMFFIFAGAFVGLEAILGKHKAHSLGFGGRRELAKRRQHLYDGLVDYGMIPEWVNRLSGILVFPEPTVPQLIQIARRGVIPAYQKLLTGCGAHISVSDEGVELMAQCAKENGTFARGIKTIVARLVEDIVFEEFRGKIEFSSVQIARAIAAAGMGDEDRPMGRIT